MADTYKGLTIKIGGDTTKLTQALKASEAAIRQTQKQLQALNKAAQLDGTDANVLDKKLKVMADEALAATRRLQVLKQALSQVSAKGVDNEGMKQLASNTAEATYKAEKAREAYASVVAEIKQLKNAVTANFKSGLGLEDKLKSAEKALESLNGQMRTLKQSEGFSRNTNEFKQLNSQITQAAKKVEVLRKALANDPFAGLETSAAAVKAQMEKLGASMEQTAQYSKLVKQYFNELNNLELSKTVAEFRDLEVQVAAAEADVRAFHAQMSKLRAETPVATTTAEFQKLEAELRQVGTVADQLKTRLSTINEAYYLDSTNIDIAKARFQALASEVSTGEARIKVLREQIAQLDAMGAKKVVSDVQNLGLELEKAKARLTELNTKFDLLKADAGFDEKSAEAKELAAAVEKAATRVDELAIGLKRVAATDALATTASHVAALKAQLSGAATPLSSLTGTFQQLGWSLYSTVMPAIQMFLSYTISAATSVDAAYRDMRKTVQGTEEQFEALKNAALEYSQTHFTSAEDLLEIEALGGQLGIATENLQSFATTVSNLDIATDLDADTAATELGQLQSIMNDMTQSDFASYGDALTRLGNNNATLESKISDVMLRISSMGTIVGFTTPQLLAWSTTIAATGQGAESAGTAISKTMSSIETAVSGGGQKLQQFAEIAGMSASEFAEAWSSSPSDALYAFIQGLTDIEAAGGSADSALVGLGITSTRQKQAIEGLMQTIGSLNANLTMSQDAWDGVSDEWGQAGDAAREADKKAEGLSGSVQKLSNTFTVFASQVGESLAPVIDALASVLKAVSEVYSILPDGVKMFLNIGAAATTAFSGTLIVISAVGRAYEQVTKMLGENSAWSRARESVKGFEDGVKGVVEAAKQNASAQMESAAATEASAAADEAKAASSATAAAAQDGLAAASEATAAADEANAVAAEAAAVANEEFAATSTAAAAAEGELAATSATTAVAEGEVAASAATAAVAEEGLAVATGTAASAMTLFKAALVSTGIGALVVALGAAIGYVMDFAESAATYDDSLNSMKEANEAFAQSAEGLAATEVDYKKSLGDIKSEHEELSSSLTEMENGFTSAWNKIGNSNSQLNKYAETIKKFGNAGKLSSSDLEQLKSAIDGVNHICGTNYKILDETTGQLNATNEELQSGVDAWKQYKEAITAQEQLEQVRSKLEELYALQEEYKSSNSPIDTIAEYEDLAVQIANLEEQERNLIPVAAEATAATDSFTAATAAQSEETQQLADEVSNLIDKYPNLLEAFGMSGASAQTFATMLSNAGMSADELGSKIESYASTAGDAFGRISEASTLSTQEMLENMEYNTSVTQSWADDLNTLYGQASTDSERAFLDNLQSMGPEYANIVHQILEDGNLSEFGQRWEEAGAAATAAASLAFQNTGTAAGQAYQTALAQGLDSSTAMAAAKAQESAQAVTTGASGAIAADGTIAAAGATKGTETAQAFTDTASAGVAVGAATIGEMAAANLGISMNAAGVTGGQGLAQGVNSTSGEANAAGSNVAQSSVDGANSKTGEASQAGTNLAQAGQTAINSFQGTYQQEGAALGSNYAVGLWSKTGEAARAGSDVSKSGANALSTYKDHAWQWGAHMGSNFAAGLWSKTGEAASAAAAVAQAAADNLGHTIAKEGPLHNGGKGEKPWGAHTIQNYIDGMESQLPELRSTMAKVASVTAGYLDSATKFEYAGGRGTTVLTAPQVTVNPNIAVPENSGQVNNYYLSDWSIGTPMNSDQFAEELVNLMYRWNVLKEA